MPLSSLKTYPSGSLPTNTFNTGFFLFSTYPLGSRPTNSFLSCSNRLGTLTSHFLPATWWYMSFIHCTVASLLTYDIKPNPRELPLKSFFIWKRNSVRILKEMHCDETSMYAEYCMMITVRHHSHVRIQPIFPILAINVPRITTNIATHFSHNLGSPRLG